MYFKTILLLLTAICLLSACSKENALECDPSECEPIDSDILVSAYLNMDGNVILQAETEKHYTCYNYSIAHTVSILQKEIRIEFHNVRIPFGCMFAIGPAVAIIDLGKLKPGNHSLKFRLNPVLIEGLLYVGEDLEVLLPSSGIVRAK